MNAISAGEHVTSKTFIGVRRPTAPSAADQEKTHLIGGSSLEAQGTPPGVSSGFVKLPQEETGRVYSFSNGNGPSGCGSSVTSSGSNANKNQG